jgi:hypothetical protein
LIEGPRNPERGLEAAKNVVRSGKLDERYRRAAWQYTKIICLLPLVIYLSWELYQRRFLGKEQKRLVPKEAEKQEGMGVVEDVG